LSANDTGGRLDLDDLQSEKSYAAMRVYGTSKLRNILFTRRQGALAPGPAGRPANRLARRDPMAVARPPKVPAAGRQLERYLRTLAGAKPGARLLEIRFGLRRGEMGRVFLAAHSAAGATNFIRRLASRTDVYVEVAAPTSTAAGSRGIKGRRGW
jgi:hypothetical protein